MAAVNPLGPAPITQTVFTELDYRVPLLLVTKTVLVKVPEEYRPFVGVIVADTGVAPRVEGRQTQVAVIFGEVPDVVRFTQLAIFTFLALNKTFPAIETFTVIVTAVLKAGFAENEIELTVPNNRPST